MIYIAVIISLTDDIRYIYMAYPITWSISSVIYFIYYHFSDWVHGFDSHEQPPRSKERPAIVRAILNLFGRKENERKA